MRSPLIRRTGCAVVAGLAIAGLPATAAQAEPSAPPAPPPSVVAAGAADRAAANGLDAPQLGPAQEFHRVSLTQGGAGLFYAAYERSYAGLRVVGGDAVVVVDGTGAVHDTVAAPTDQITVDTRAGVSAGHASKVARAQLPTVGRSSTPELVVLAGDAPRLAYEVLVTGRSHGVPSKLHVYVDAETGAVAQSWDEVRADALTAAPMAAQPDDAALLGSGNGYYNGNVSIDTTAAYSMRDPNRRGLSCGNNNTKRVYTGSDDVWGNGSGTDLETACVDAYYAVQHEWDMLGDWLGRNGINGQGGGFPAWVGLNQANAFWDGSSATFGRSSDGRRQVTSMDVVAHEFGHAIFQTTPGGPGGGNGNEKGGMNESTGDIFGALTEHFANNPNDPPDYLVGEEVNLVGGGPIRNMYNPRAYGHPNCYSSSIPGTEVHAAAGPQNHWFFLLAEGSNGSPSSPTCNGSTVNGIGIEKAGLIFYNGLLRKTSAWSHAAARRATVAAALDLFPGSCTEFNAVRAAWSAIDVPPQGGEGTCDAQPADNDFSLSVNPASATVEPGQSATTTVTTTLTEGSAQTIDLRATGLPTGATATFAPATIQSGDNATLTITTTAGTPNGTTRVTITGDGTEIDHTVQFTLTVGTGNPPGCDAPAWSASTSYQPGDLVSHNTHEWESTWYSTGAEPDAPSSWAVWRDLGAC